MNDPRLLMLSSQDYDAEISRIREETESISSENTEGFLDEVQHKIQEYMLTSYGCHHETFLQLEQSEEKTEAVKAYIELLFNTHPNTMAMLDFDEDDFKATYILQMLTDANKYCEENFGEGTGVKEYTIKKIFNMYAYVEALKYAEEFSQQECCRYCNEITQGCENPACSSNNICTACGCDECECSEESECECSEESDNEVQQ
jgi:hypothetical protein